MKAFHSRGNGDIAMHMPTFDFFEERNKLKEMTKQMNRQHMLEEEALSDENEGMDEEEIDGEHEGMEEGDEEEDFEGLEEGDEEMLEEGDMEGEEEFDGEEEEDEEEGMEEEDDKPSKPVTKKQQPISKGKKIEAAQKGSKNGKKHFREDEQEDVRDDEASGDEVNSSFYDESESESEEDPRNSFLSSSAIFDPNISKKRLTRDQIKLQKADNRAEHLSKKAGHKIKSRGRLTNQQKKKNNPYQMFIQKRRLDNRLKDLKKANKKGNKNMKQAGHTQSRKLGKTLGKKR